MATEPKRSRAADSSKDITLCFARPAPCPLVPQLKPVAQGGSALQASRVDVTPFTPWTGRRRDLGGHTVESFQSSSGLARQISTVVSGGQRLRGLCS